MFTSVQNSKDGANTNMLVTLELADSDSSDSVFLDNKIEELVDKIFSTLPYTLPQVLKDHKDYGLVKNNRNYFNSFIPNNISLIIKSTVKYSNLSLEAEEYTLLENSDFKRVMADSIVTSTVGYMWYREGK